MLIFATSDKGGTGRSVTSTNLAYRHALQGKDSAVAATSPRVATFAHRRHFRSVCPVRRARDFSALSPPVRNCYTERPLHDDEYLDMHMYHFLA
jgi:hypothetical protein